MKAVLLSCLLILPIGSAFAQGALIFQNDSRTLVSLASIESGTSLGLAPRGTHVALYYSPTPVTDVFSPSLHLITNGIGIVAPISGRFSLGTKTTGTDVIGGSTIYVSVRGWTGNYSDWDSAYAATLAGTPGAGVGYTAVFPMGTVDPISSLPRPALNTNPEFTGVTIYVVPEPSAFGLLACAVILALKYRRKRVRERNN